ncbi:MAG: transcriptional regulator BetI [Litoreibacter sp.]
MARRRIRDIRNEALIDATISAVSEHGYAMVTMADIAAGADTTAASINYYFGSKEKLMEATMLRLLSILKNALLERYAVAKTPRERLEALIDANFDDRLFTAHQCSVWMQFWSYAPYSPRLSRLHRINRARVQSHVRAELRSLVPEAQRETVRATLQAYMDGVWLEAAQSHRPVIPNTARNDAKRVLNLLIGSA